MMTDKERGNKNPIMSKSTSLYRILSLLLIINYYRMKNGKRKWKGLNIRVIQLYMWGLSGNDNADILEKMNKRGGFPTVPFSYNAYVMQLLAYCHVNGFLTIDKLSKDTVYDLTPKAHVLLTTLKNDDLRKEIDESLARIGLITKGSSEELRIDWSDVTY